MKHLSIICYTLLFLFIVYYYNEYVVLKESFDDQCIDEDNKIRKLKEDEKPVKSKSVKKQNKKTIQKDNREVFHIYNKYNYLEAREICKIYNGRLANEKDLLNAYNNGANWCSWGWLDGQKIGYPVQDKYWTEMEKKHKGFCGTTAGINKMENIDPLQRYGINCYGIKPSKTKNDTELEMVINESTGDNALKKEIEKCKNDKIKAEHQKWINKQKSNIRIVEFNQSKWSNVKKNKVLSKKKKSSKGSIWW